MAMLRFAAARLGVALLTLFCVVSVVFFSSRFTGNPAALFIPYDATPQIQHQIEHELGFDRPVVVQYGLFLLHALEGNFGVSYRSGESVVTLIRQRLPASLLLTGISLLMSIVIGVPVGVLAAVHRGRWVDTVARGFAFLGQAVPSFFLGIVLIQVVALHVSWLPVSGDSGWSAPLLPALTLTAFLGAAIVRLLRSSMLEALQSEYVRMARLKGLSEAKVIWKHAFKNALLPVLALTGMYAALSVTVAVVVEVVFAWPGLGQLTYEAIINRDLPVLQAVVVVASVVTISLSLLVDWVSAIIDPRLRIAVHAHR